MKYRNTKERILHSIWCNLLMTLTFACLGCQDQELVQKAESTDAITFALYQPGDYDQSFTPLSRTLEKPLVLVNEDGTDSLTFYLTVTDTIDLNRSVNQAETLIARGTPITSGNLATCTGEIALDAFYENAPFMKDELHFTDDGIPHTGITRYWPANEGAKVAFWSYHPKEIDEAANAAFHIVNDGIHSSLSFNYDMKADGNKLKDVTEQEDLFLAYAYQGKEDGAVKLKYEHALSAIKFDAGKALAATIQNITLTDVDADGTLTYTPQSGTKLSWILGENSSSTIDQNFDVEIDENLLGNPSQGVTIDNTVFLLIPQSVTGKELSVTIKRCGKDQTDTYTVPMPEGEWEMGKTYTYTLKLVDGLDIEASSGDVMEENGKDVVQGVEISNTYNKSCYIRAMIMGNWVDSDGNVAAIFNSQEVDLKIAPANENYTLSADWTNNWDYDATADIYYYKKPLDKGETVKLFEKFENPINRTNDGLSLEFVVLVQAVEAEADASKKSVKDAWGESIANILQ